MPAVEPVPHFVANTGADAIHSVPAMISQGKAEMASKIASAVGTSPQGDSPSYSPPTPGKAPSNPEAAHTASMAAHAQANLPVPPSIPEVAKASAPSVPRGHDEVVPLPAPIRTSPVVPSSDHGREGIS